MMRGHQLSTFDQLYRSILLTKFFTKGWGSPANLKTCFENQKYFANRESCIKLLERYDNPVQIDKEAKEDGLEVKYGRLKSPLASLAPEMVEPPVDNAVFKMVLPNRWRYSTHKPICIHLAATGDHYFWRRYNLMAKPLAREDGIASIILENPFYGHRKPKEQTRSSLRNVTDLFVMGGCLIMECLALLRWSKQIQLDPFCLTGISLGGHMASLAAGYWPSPIALVPCLSWSTASHVFTQGALSGAIPWKILEQQYEEYEQSGVLKQLPQDAVTNTQAFRMGQDFAKNYPQSVDAMQELQEDQSEAKTEPRPQTKLLALSGGVSAVLNSVAATLPRRRATNAQVIQFMNGLMDEFTHLANFPKPVDCSLVIAVEAAKDAYIPRHNVMPLDEIWPEAEVRYIEGMGHVQGILWNSALFRATIAEATDRLRDKYHTVS